jgi:hypothetical protein
MIEVNDCRVKLQNKKGGRIGGRPVSLVMYGKRCARLCSVREDQHEIIGIDRAVAGDVFSACIAAAE